MNEYIEVISQIKPKNNGKFPIADVNDLKGGYIQVNTVAEMEAFLLTTKLKEGMLCYVKSDVTKRHMYQFLGTTWIPWSHTSGGASGGTSVQIVPTLNELLSSDFKITGQLVFVSEIDELRYYNGSNWKSFNRIYIQNVPPEDLGGIWIDTSEDKEFLDSNTVIQNLLQVISILQDKVSKLEWAFKSQMDFGDFKNNQRHEYTGYTGMEPSYGLSVEEEEALQSENLLAEVMEEVEPIGYKDELPNGTHLCIKSGTYAEMLENQADFLPKELLWCSDKHQLWIKDPRTLKLIQIGSSTSGGSEEPIDEFMEQILLETVGSAKKIIGIEFADMTNKNNTYIVQVADGKLEVVNKKLLSSNLAGNAQEAAATLGYYKNPYFPLTSSQVGSEVSPKIYINMVYTGGKNDENSYAECSHNFVELSNVGNTDLNLKGLFLHYTEGPVNGVIRNWVTLPLQGTLKSNGTFLIRGAQSSYMDVNTTIIKVNTFDMEWSKDITKNADVLEVQENIDVGVQKRTIWNSKNLIMFNPECSLYISGAETPNFFDTEEFDIVNPYFNKSGIKWYVDLVGFGPAGTAAEGSPLASYGTQFLQMRYFNMDGVVQATKAFTARNNNVDWISVNLANPPEEYNIEDLRPRASWEGKNLFFNKDLITAGPPRILNCTFGHNAHTTRCFNWVSKDYYNEYIQIAKINDPFTETLGVDMFESFKEGDGRTSNKNWNNKIYNRIREISTDGTAFTTHKFIKDFIEPQQGEEIVYKYKAGRPGNWTDERTFTLRNRNDVIVNGHTFLQLTDEQGFTEEEYEVVKLTTDFIKKDSVDNNYSYDFVYNTGDISQNGNRFNEWINYFDGRKEIFKDKEVMYIVGNNDLSPIIVNQLGNASADLNKCNPMNVNYFFTFEHPYTIPTSSSGIYIPSIYSFFYGDTLYLAMNSEITGLTLSDVVFQDSAINIYSESIKGWCDNELSNIDSDPQIKWRISATHEAPFTLLTMEYIMKYNKNNATERDGSHLNTIGNYWYSKFLEDNKFNLSLCGHKHTFTNSRYIRESRNPGETMKPIIYEPELESAAWYQTLNSLGQADVGQINCCQLSNDTSQWYVKYVMNQGTGYKLASNKEAPAPGIPWLLRYYPVNVTSVNLANSTATITVSGPQQFPHYILWNIGRGTEAEDPTETVSLRDRIKGSVFKIGKKSTSINVSWPFFKYRTRARLTDLEKLPGNGVGTTANHNIIVERLFI